MNYLKKINFQKFNKLISSFLAVFLFFVLLSILFSGENSVFSSKTKEVSLSQLIQTLREEKVKQVVVQPKILKVILNNGEELIAEREQNSSFPDMLKTFGFTPEQISALNIEVRGESGFNFWMGMLLPILLPILVLVWFFYYSFRRTNKGAMQIFSFSRANIKLFNRDKNRITFKDVAGLKEAKEEMKEVVDFLKHPKKFQNLGARIPRGVLLMGAPGSGKTLLARAVAGEANVPFFHMSGSEFVEMFVGVGASRVRDAFLTAKKAAPSILFIDEIDAIGRIRGAGVGGGHDEREQTLNQILVEMDGFDRDTRVIVMAASVTGDTPVLIRNNNHFSLLPIKKVIDPYYQEEEGDIEKETQGDFEILGYMKKNQKANYFGAATFQQVRGVFRHKVREIYEVEYLGGKIRTTGSHSVFVRSKGGIKAKAVSQLSPGDILVDLPYKVNCSNKELKEIRAFKFQKGFHLKLPVWQPLFNPYRDLQRKYDYALAQVGQISQVKLGAVLGFSPSTIGKWQQGSCLPRPLSKKYYQHSLPEEVEVTPELMRLFGYYVAEGYSRKEVDFCFNIREKSKVADVESLMKRIFNLKPDRERRVISNNAINITYYSKPLAEFFAYYCGRGASHKHIPEFLFTAPKKYFVEFLKGYFYGDGYQDERGRLEMTSISKQLILELNWLARMHGFKSYIHSFKTKEGRVIKNGKPLKSNIAWRIGFGKTQNPFHKVEGKASTKRAIVRKIKRIPYNDYVYDFCGCENEAFFGGESPILLHNTNRPDILDPALLRPGRFDRRIILDLPNIKDREEVLQIHTRDKNIDSQVSLREIAERTPGFSGADLANLVNEAAILAARRGKRQITQKELLDSIEKVMLGPERRSRILTKKEKEITAYHEAGHALVSALLPDTAQVRKVSIIARGKAGGYTMRTPREEKYMKTRSEFLNELCVLLGGYVAEEIQFKDISTGAANDLKEASDVARSLVTKYGMSKKIGPISFGRTEDLVFLGKEITTEKDYSEKTATIIDEEVSKILKNSYRRTKKILQKNKSKLDRIAKELIKKETLEKEEFERLVKE